MLNRKEFFELMEIPTVLIDDKEYVPLELYNKFLISELEGEKLDCKTQEQKYGIETAQQVILNRWKEE